MRRPRAKFVRISEERNALDFLEKAYEFICRVDKTSIDWKWVAISLHGALYGFAICACRGTNPDRVTYTTKKGDSRLIDFDEALKRCQDPAWMLMTVMSKPLELSAEQRNSVKMLKDLLRNNFEHFTPKLWAIELHGLPDMAIDVLEAIRFLALDTGNYVNLGQFKMKVVRSLIFQSKKVLKSSKLYSDIRQSVTRRPK